MNLCNLCFNLQWPFFQYSAFDKKRVCVKCIFGSFYLITFNYWISFGLFRFVYKKKCSRPVVLSSSLLLFMLFMENTFMFALISMEIQQKCWSTPRSSLNVTFFVFAGTQCPLLTAQISPNPSVPLHSPHRKSLFTTSLSLLRSPCW